MIERTEIDTVARRGRPKGSGIDDTATLERVVALLSADKRLKPTTAIKQAGVSDPSIVRRLREKLKAASVTDVAPRSLTSATTQETAPPERKQKKSEAAALKSKHAVVKKKVAAKATAAEAPSPKAQNQTQAPQPNAEEIAKRQREAAMLSAYLKAMIESANRPQTQIPPAQQAATPPPPASNQTTEKSGTTSSKTEPRGFHFPGFPPFMQPFMPKPQAPAPAVQKQMDGLKLSVEAMTALARLQLHFYENALSTSPLSLMLQGQTMMGQMMLAAFTGRGFSPPKSDPEKR